MDSVSSGNAVSGDWSSGPVAGAMRWARPVATFDGICQTNRSLVGQSSSEAAFRLVISLSRWWRRR